MDAPNISLLAASLERCVLAALAGPARAEDCPLTIDSDVVKALRQQGVPAEASRVRLVTLDARLFMAGETAHVPLVDMGVERHADAIAASVAAGESAAKLVGSHGAPVDAGCPRSETNPVPPFPRHLPMLE